MKILHTSDWHIGKVLKGRSRFTEQIEALNEVVKLANTEQPDLVIVAGDLYDTAAPTPDAIRLVTRALSALRNTGADVVVIAGNHDNGPGLDALRAWAEAARISLRGSVKDRPEDYIIRGTTRGGEQWRCVALPFISQRYAVRALEMFELTEAQAQATYADHIARLIERLTTDAFETDTVNLITAHLTVLGGMVGGGERDAHTILGYAVPSTVFPASTHYVALGHLHRAQLLPAACPVRYSGSPFAVDFGEEDNRPSVTIVEVTAKTAAQARIAEINGVPLRTVRGTLAELTQVQVDEDAWLRVIVSEPARAGLREQVQEMFPKALEIRVEAAAHAERTGRPSHTGRTAPELFADYLKHRGHEDQATQALFERLYGEVSS